jgi:hypothetical protein
LILNILDILQSQQRMMDNGIGSYVCRCSLAFSRTQWIYLHIFTNFELFVSDMLSLGLPALHIAPFFLYKNVDKSVDMNDVDSQEQYFEVPHWMHLSFVSYNSDKSIFSSNQIENIQKADGPLLSNLERLEIRSNGFLLPRVFANEPNSEPVASHLLHPSLATSAASLKSFRFSSERQLIAGRDFRDILEACRPWNASTLPTPLRSIIESLAYTTAPYNNAKVNGFPEHSNCKEWGTLDHSYSSQGDSLGYQPRSFSFVREPEESDSTYLRPDTHSALAKPYERPNLSLYSSIGVPCLHLQRPVSHGFSIPLDGKHEANSGKTSLNLSDDEVELSSNDERQSFEERLRHTMHMHDLTFSSISNSLASDVERETVAETNLSQWKPIGRGQAMQPNAAGMCANNPQLSAISTAAYVGGALRNYRPRPELH